MRARGNSLLCTAFAVLLGAGSAAADVPSDRTAQAEVLFKDARALMANGQFEQACPKLRASHELDPGYGTVWNLAECLSKQGKTASAWAAYLEAGDMARKAGQAERVEKAARRAAELEPRLEKLTVTVANEVPGLVVKRDGITVARAAWGSALPIDPGKHVLEAAAPGKVPWKSEITSKGPAEIVTIQVPALADAPAPPAAAPAERAQAVQDTGPATRRTVGLIVGSAGIAGLAVGAVLGGIAAGKWSNAQDNHCRTTTLCDAEGVKLAGDAKSLAGASTGLFIGGGVLAAAGTTLFLTGLGRKKATTGLVVQPLVGAVNGLAIDARF